MEMKKPRSAQGQAAEPPRNGVTRLRTAISNEKDPSAPQACRLRRRGPSGTPRVGCCRWGCSETPMPVPTQSCWVPLHVARAGHRPSLTLAPQQGDRERGSEGQPAAPWALRPGPVAPAASGLAQGTLGGELGSLCHLRSGVSGAPAPLGSCSN